MESNGKFDDLKLTPIIRTSGTILKNQTQDKTEEDIENSSSSRSRSMASGDRRGMAES